MPVVLRVIAPSRNCRVVGFVFSLVMVFSVFEAIAQTTEQQKFLPYPDVGFSDGENNDFFGGDVSIWGETLVIGGSGDYFGAGSAGIYDWNGTSWALNSVIGRDLVGLFDFGGKVEISGDWVFVWAIEFGAPISYDNVVYVYKRTGNSWAFHQRLIAPDHQSGNGFGTALAVDGDTLAIGSPMLGDAGAVDGAVYVFVLSGETWSFQQKLQPGTMSADSDFGYAVDISGDTIVAGAPHESTDAFWEGRAYVFKRTGNSWAEEYMLVPGDIDRGDEFGTVVAIEGEMIVASSVGDGHTIFKDGSAYVFASSGSTWQEQDKIVPATLGDYYQFGGEIAMVDDLLLISAGPRPIVGGLVTSVYAYHRMADSWEEWGDFNATDTEAGDGFGGSIAISGEFMLIGAGGNDEPGRDMGAAYIFYKNSVPVDLGEFVLE